MRFFRALCVIPNTFSGIGHGINFKAFVFSLNIRSYAERNIFVVGKLEIFRIKTIFKAKTDICTAVGFAGIRVKITEMLIDADFGIKFISRSFPTAVRRNSHLIKGHKKCKACIDCYIFSDNSPCGSIPADKSISVSGRSFIFIGISKYIALSVFLCCNDFIAVLVSYRTLKMVIALGCFFGRKERDIEYVEIFALIHGNSAAPMRL